jgi:Zn-finger nucleic acid-binding protein
MAFRDEHLACPACGKAALSDDHAIGITRWECAACGGVWLDRAALAALVDKLELPIDELAGRAAGASSRGCPRCRAPMATLTVDAITLDTCADHGLWFDRAELEPTIEALQREAEAARPLAKRIHAPWWYRIYEFAVRVEIESQRNRNRTRPRDWE